jgi:hypothetical protein
MELLYILAVAVIVHKTTPTKDIIGSIMGGMIIYMVIKVPAMFALMYFNGWAFAFPIQVPPWAHTISGGISVAAWAFLLFYKPIPKVRYYLAKRKLKRIMVTAITGK